MKIYVISENIADLRILASGAKALTDEVTAVFFGNEAAAKSSQIKGANTILYTELKEGFCPEDYANAIAEEVKKEESAYVFIGNTIRGKALAGKLAVKLDTAVLTNAASVSKDGDKLIADRTVYGGTAHRTQQFEKPYGVFTFGAGAFEADQDLDEAKSFIALEGEPVSLIKKTESIEKTEVSVNLAVAKRIVDVGRGLAKEEDLALIKDLASTLGAEIGCSRPVAENLKWLPKAQYVGITGVEVKPDFIFTCGVSGQVQHTGGINKAKVIVSVNKDKSAPIFKCCDFGLVGDMYKIIPQLIEKLK